MVLVLVLDSVPQIIELFFLFSVVFPDPVPTFVCDKDYIMLVTSFHWSIINADVTVAI